MSYIKYISITLLIVGLIVMFQFVFVLDHFKPYYLIAPFIASVLIGILLTHLHKKTLKIHALEFEVYTDPLTGLPNRLALNKDIVRMKAQVMYILDISSFSSLNDLYGEQVGDEILKEIASFLKGLTSHSCQVYRYMGDQFAFLSNKQMDEEAHTIQMQNMHAQIEHHLVKVTIGHKEIELYISIVMGAATKNITNSIIEKADMALNFAKREKHSAVLYAKNLKIEAHYEADLAQTELVKNALKYDLIIPVFQPIVKGEEISYECLVRIKSGATLIPPSGFLKAIKKTRYYSELTKVMIRKSFAHFSHKQGVSFSINLSFEDIANSEVNHYLFEMIETYNIGSRLIIELVESESIDNFTMVKAFIHALRAYGARIAIDDFGSGYSNFSYLLEMRPDFIKIDGSIIKEIATCKDSYHLTKLIHDASKSMNIQTIAEFIHSKEVHEKAKELGIDAFQGYFLGEPSL